MIEFVAGVLVTVYLGVFAALVYTERKYITRGTALNFPLWPLVLTIGPIARYVFKRWKYEYRLSTLPWDEGKNRKAWFLKPGRKANDEWGWGPLWNWLKRKARRED